VGREGVALVVQKEACIMHSFLFWQKTMEVQEFSISKPDFAVQTGKVKIKIKHEELRAKEL
jgi:hypothetical protein